MNYYKHIDELPIKIWFEILGGGSKSLLLKTECDNIDFEALEVVWFSLYDQYVKFFGFPVDFITSLNNEIKIAKYKADYLITRQRHYLTMIKIAEINNKQIEQPKNDNFHVDIILSSISPKIGFKLDSNNLTVIQYYTYLKQVING